jgi:ribonuclease III
MAAGRPQRPCRQAALTLDAALDWAEAALGHRFADPALLRRALTHGSASTDSYQRLEFLGDRVLGLVMAAWLYDDFDDDEGRLSRRLTELVSGDTCAAVAQRIGAAEHLRLNPSARASGAKHSVNILGDVCEALIAALWLDGGWSAADRFVRQGWSDAFAAHAGAPSHPKSALQELAARRRLGAPRYDIVDRSGPQHQSRFRIRVSLHGFDPAEAEGSSKSDAERAAAALLLERISE